MVATRRFGRVFNTGAPFSPYVLAAALERRDETLFDMVVEQDWLDDKVALTVQIFGPAAKWGKSSVISKLSSLLWTNTSLSTLWASYDSDKKNALNIAAGQKNLEVLEALIHLGRPTPDMMYKACVTAVSNKDIDMVRLLFTNGADSANDEALQRGVSAGPEMLDFLLARFIHQYPDGKHGFGAEALWEAMQSDQYPGALDVLLEAKMDVNSVIEIRDWRTLEKQSEFRFWSSLGLGISKLGIKGFPQIRKLLLHGADPDAIAGCKNFPPCSLTALLVAIETGSVQLVDLLLEAGAHVNKEPRLGVRHTPLQKACEVGSFEITQLLMQRGALVTAPAATANGGTALQCAAKSGNIRIVQMLLDNGAKWDSPMSVCNGRTPLEAAAEHGRFDMLRYMCEEIRPKDASVFDGKQMERAIRFAKKNGNMACKEYLQSISRGWCRAISNGSG